MESHERTTKMLSYRKRHNSRVGTNRPDDKLWDLVAACKVHAFVPFVPLDKLVSQVEATQRVKKVSKDDDGVDREKDVSKDRPPRGLWDVSKRLSVLSVVADLELGSTTTSDLQGGDPDAGEVKEACERYREHVLEMGLTAPRASLRQLMYAEKLAWMERIDMTQSEGMTLVQAVGRTINDGNLWNNKMYKMPDDEFVEYKPDRNRPRTDKSAFCVPIRQI